MQTLLHIALIYMFDDFCMCHQGTILQGQQIKWTSPVGPFLMHLFDSFSTQVDAGYMQTSGGCTLCFDSIIVKLAVSVTALHPRQILHYSGLWNEGFYMLHSS